LQKGSSLWKNVKRKTRPARPMVGLIGLFDVLGFESQFAKNGLKEMARKYRLLIASAKRAAEQPIIVSAMMPGELPFTFVPEPGEEVISVFVGPPEINHAYFSDTILLWSPYQHVYVQPFFNACMSMVQESLAVGLPLRGGFPLATFSLAVRRVFFSVLR
jgi:hypothetical protein